jgi:hypothetical protein
MSEPDRILVDAYRARLAPVFSVAVPPLDSEMDRTIGEPLILPDPATLAKARRPLEETAAARADSVAWLRRVFREEHQDPREDLDLVGMREAVQGKDALFGEWRAPGIALQVIVTFDRLHLRGRLGDPRPAASDAERAALAQAEARRLLPLRAVPWTAPRGLGPLVFSVQDVDFCRSWDEAAIVVTDGVGFALSMLKLLDRKSRPKRGGLPAGPPPPWCPRPELPGA